MWRCLLSLLFVVVCWTTAAPAQSGDPTRVKALLIGVRMYPKLDRKFELRRTERDAAGFRDVLVSKLHVPTRNVVVLNSPSASVIRKAFERHLDSLDPGDVSIIYFSGHGREKGGVPYLLASDYLDSLLSEAISLKWLIREFEQDHGDALGIFVIDACRRDPSLPFGKYGVEAASFAPIVAPLGTFVMYSASPGQIALEHLGFGDTSPYSLYTRVILPMLEDTTLGLHEIAKDARWDVYKMAQTRKDPSGAVKPHNQIPAYYDEVLQRRNILGAVLPPARRTKRPANDAIAFLAPSTLQAGTGTKGIGLWSCRDCPEMVVVPKPVGKVRVGSEDRERGHKSHEGPVREVEIPRRFAIGKFEVTRGEWLACEESDLKPRCPKRLGRKALPDDRRPMVDVSWKDAKAYVNWLNTLVGKASQSGANYRLPSEAEWEYAARAGGLAPYPSGNDRTELCKFANGADASLKTLLWANIACNDGRARGVTSVGSYEPNRFGLHDMSGNVWEWVEDCYAPGHGGLPSDGSAYRPKSGQCRRHVAKGGSWRSGPGALRAAARQAFKSEHRRATLGFRVARDIEVAE